MPSNCDLLQLTLCDNKHGFQRTDAPLKLIIPPFGLSTLHHHKNQGSCHDLGEEEEEEEEEEEG
jgi:hypothetical protein